MEHSQTPQSLGKRNASTTSTSLADAAGTSTSLADASGTRTRLPDASGTRTKLPDASGTRKGQPNAYTGPEQPKRRAGMHSDDDGSHKTARRQINTRTSTRKAQRESDHPLPTAPPSVIHDSEDLGHSPSSLSIEPAPCPGPFSTQLPPPDGSAVIGAYEDMVGGSRQFFHHFLALMMPRSIPPPVGVTDERITTLLTALEHSQRIIGKLAERMDETTASVDKLRADVASTGTKVDESIAGVVPLAKRMDETTASVDKLRAEVASIRTKVDESIAETTASVDKLRAEVASTGAKIDESEALAARHFRDLETQVYIAQRDIIKAIHNREPAEHNENGDPGRAEGEAGGSAGAPRSSFRMSCAPRTYR